MSDTTNLTEKEYWDKTWENLPLPARLNVRAYPVRRFHEIFQKMLPKKPGLAVLELGCAPGKWLLYFAEYFGYRMHGIEYSPAGYKKTLENVSLSGQQAVIVQGDLFETTLAEKMDIVFSYGVIEHFNDIRPVLRKHLEHLAPGGTVVVMVPNIASPLYRTLQGMAAKTILEYHYPVSLAMLKKNMSALSVQELFCGYAGVFNLGMVNWARTPKLLLHGINFINRIVLGTARLFGARLETRVFSPYLLYIGRAAGGGERP